MLKGVKVWGNRLRVMAMANDTGAGSDFNNYIQCPITGQLVLKDERERFWVEDKQATWWYCPACGSWHIAMESNPQNKANT